jgi:hypothetical protein
MPNRERWSCGSGGGSNSGCSYREVVATIDYAAVCEAIEQRPSPSVWPNIRRLGKNRVDVPAFPATVKLPLLIAARLSSEEAEKGPQVLEILVEIYDIVADSVVDRVELADPIEDVSRMTPGPVGFPILLTPTIEVTLPRSAPFLIRVKGWSGHYDFLLAALARCVDQD